jgi:hypothetical protein
MRAIPSVPFHARVRVRSKSPQTRDIDNRLGYVAGITDELQGNGQFGYGIFIYDLARVWCCDESELEPTGEFDHEAIARAEGQKKRLAQERLGSWDAPAHDTGV